MRTRMARREKKRAADARTEASERQQQLETAVRDQRTLVRRLGEAQARTGSGYGTAGAHSSGRERRGDEVQLWSEEAGRRFAAQQEELVELRDRVAELTEALEGRGTGGQEGHEHCNL